MVINGRTLLRLNPIKNMLDCKVQDSVASHGLVEAGYDIRLKQNINFHRHPVTGIMMIGIDDTEPPRLFEEGRFTIASAIEEFDMPDCLVGIVHDKSTWARKGLSVFNTVIEPGWKGFLTLELVYHGHEDLIIPAGSGIAQVIFHELVRPASYDGRYQNQENKPVAAKQEE